MGAQLFDEVIGDLPPSGVDIEGIVRREKRRRAARRATGLATAVVALSVTGALGLTMASGTGASSPPAAGPSASTSVPDTRFALVADSAESAAGTAKRLSEALDVALQKAAPGAEWIFEPGVAGETGPDGQVPKLAYKVRKNGQEMFAGDSGVQKDGRRGSLYLGIFPAGTLDCPPKGPQCVAGTTPGGAKTTLVTVDGDVVVYHANVELPDKRVLTIIHSNDFGPDGAGAAQPDTPLTSEQTMAIAIDVASHIKP